jgi:hypothetical protein
VSAPPKLASFARPASRLVVGGFRPPADPRASWFGRVRLARPGEAWPEGPDGPMIPLCQLNLAEAPFRPPALEDVALVTIFMAGLEEWPDGAPNGEGWRLRAYPSLEGLVEVAAPAGLEGPKPFPVRYERIVDYPCHDDLPAGADFTDEDHDRHPNQSGSKLGGWPSLIQSEIFWAPGNEHPASPAYVFQIDSEEKAGWAWGDAGAGYFGRGTGAHRDVWTLSWQCM